VDIAAGALSSSRGPAEDLDNLRIPVDGDTGRTNDEDTSTSSSSLVRRDMQVLHRFSPIKVGICYCLIPSVEAWTLCLNELENTRWLPKVFR
jgi:hypothetical protein